MTFSVRALLLLLLALVPLQASSTSLSFAGTEHVKAELFADLEAAVPGKPFRLGLKMVIEEGWHTYWRNPGDSGARTSLTWQLPEGVEAGPPLLPLPEAIPYFDLMNYGYEGETLVTSEMTLSPDWPAGEPLEIGLVADWLVCADICVPGSVELSLLLPTSAGEPRQHPINGFAFKKAEADLPRPSPFAAAFAADGEKGLTLALDGLPAQSRIDDVYFFVGKAGILRHAAEQSFTFDKGRLLVRLERDPTAPAVPEKLEGLLVLHEKAGDGAIRQGFLLEASSDPALAVSVNGGETAGLWQAVFFAFLGGLILNLMPCVFPVLSMKALSLMRHAGESGALLQGLSYTTGVILSFLGLAGTLIAIKSTGAAIGWGFQLQSPPVIAFLACLMFVVGLWLAGAIRLSGSLGEYLQGGVMNAGSGLAQKDGLAGSFFTGVLAVLVATPCTAPFMAPALGFALTQDATTALAIFAALGAGMALPFFLLSAIPALGRLLPRPGAWMEQLKEALAFPMYATAAWLLWVLSLQAGANALLAVLLGAVLLAFALWLLRFPSSLARLFAAAAFAGALFLVFITAGSQAGPRTQEAASMAQATDEKGPAEPFTQARLDELLGQNRVVFVNMTAAWCITCIVNEQAVLSTDAVRKVMQEQEITYLKGDWTNANPEITAFLESFGRSGVPIYVLYRKNSKKPLLLPQILTETTLLEAFAKAG